MNVTDSAPDSGTKSTTENNWHQAKRTSPFLKPTVPISKPFDDPNRWDALRTEDEVSQPTEQDEEKENFQGTAIPTKNQKGVSRAAPSLTVFTTERKRVINVLNREIGVGNYFIDSLPGARIQVKVKYD